MSGAISYSNAACHACWHLLVRRKCKQRCQPLEAIGVLMLAALGTPHDPHYWSVADAACMQLDAPKQRFYWGYIWDGTGNRCTAPIRNSNNKSHMPAEQVRAGAVMAASAKCVVCSFCCLHNLLVCRRSTTS